MTKLKLGVIVGSNRRESINRKLAEALVLLGDELKGGMFPFCLPQFAESLAKMRGSRAASDAH